MVNQNTNKTHCKRGHPLSDNNLIIGSDGYRRCKTCHDMTTKNYQIKNKEKINATARQWALDNPERTKEIQRKCNHKRQPQQTEYRRTIWWSGYLKQLRYEVLTHYGKGNTHCVCCGEKIMIFLTLDHINGRKDTNDNGKRAWMLLQYLRAHNYPEGYQTLCWNCNSGRSNNGGVCPHKTNEIIRNSSKRLNPNASPSTIKQREHTRQYVKQLRTDVFTHYGNGVMTCVCCGESKIQFLNIDHINGRKKHERKNPKYRSWIFMRLLRKQGYPEGYQTLCWNCNSGRQLNNGVCPHKVIS